MNHISHPPSTDVPWLATLPAGKANGRAQAFEVIVTARTWFVARDAASAVFGCDRNDLQVRPATEEDVARVNTFEKFRRTVLDGAKAIEVMVPLYKGSFAALTTSAHADAPPIFQWDREDKRNPFDWYQYNGGTHASQWGLTAGEWAKVTAVTLQPQWWHGGNFPHQGEGAFFLIEGAKDSRTGQGNALFPESLKSDLHGIRATIEAYSKSAELGGREDASACGLAIGKGRADIRLRVTDASGVRIEYRLDRWD